MLLLLSHISCVRLCDPIDGSPPGSGPWDSPGKNTGVGCHFLLQCMKVKSESEGVQLCSTLCDPMDCSPPGSSVHGISQARVLEWVAIAFSGIYRYVYKSNRYWIISMSQIRQTDGYRYVILYMRYMLVNLNMNDSFSLWSLT